MNSVMTIMTSFGEVIGRIKENTDSQVVVESPRLFAQTAEGVGFVPGVCMTGAKNPAEITFQKSNIIFITECDSMIEKSWIQQTSGLVMA